MVDQAHQNLPKSVPNTAFVSAEGLKHKGDKIHFDAASYRELGKRYAERYFPAESKTKVRALVGNLPGFVYSHDFFPQPGDLFWSPADWAWAGGLFDALLPS